MSMVWYRLLAEMASRKLSRSFALPVRQTAMCSHAANPSSDAKRSGSNSTSSSGGSGSGDKKGSKDSKDKDTTAPASTSMNERGWATPMPGTSNNNGSLPFSLIIRRLQHGISSQRRARANNALAALHTATTKSTKKSKKNASTTGNGKNDDDTTLLPTDTSIDDDTTKVLSSSSSMGPSDLSAEERRTVALIRRRFRDASLRTSALGDNEASEDHSLTRDWPARGALVIEVSVTEAAAPQPNFDHSRWPCWMPLAELLRFVNAKDPALFISVLVATSDPSTIPLLTVVRFGRGHSQCVPFLSVLPIRSAHILQCRSNEYPSLVDRGPLLSLMETKVEPMEALLFRRVMLQAADNYGHAANGNNSNTNTNLTSLTGSAAAAAAAAVAAHNNSTSGSGSGRDSHSPSDPLSSSFVTHSLLWLLDAFVPAQLGRQLPPEQQEQLRTLRNTHCSAELVVAINDFVVGADPQLIRVLPLLQSLRTAVANTFVSPRLHLDLWCTHGEEWRVNETHQLARWLAARHQRIRNKMAALRQLHGATQNNAPASTTASAPSSTSSNLLRRDISEITCVLCGSLAIFRCDGCQTAAYCSRRHAQRHWYTGHRTECATIIAVATATVTNKQSTSPPKSSSSLSTSQQSTSIQSLSQQKDVTSTAVASVSVLGGTTGTGVSGGGKNKSNKKLASEPPVALNDVNTSLPAS
jgi:hypothetical protein